MRATLGLLCGLCLAVLFSQFPEYAQQYRQRLGGAVDELRIITADFDRAAADAGLSRDAALQRYSASSDSFLQGRGVSMAATIVRFGQLSATLAAIQNAGPLERLQHLPQYLDSEIGARALADFQPAVPVTPEGFAWAAAGLFLGYVVSMAIINVVTLPFRWRRGQTPGHVRFLRRRGRRRQVVPAASPFSPSAQLPPETRLPRPRREI